MIAGPAETNAPPNAVPPNATLRRARPPGPATQPRRIWTRRPYAGRYRTIPPDREGDRTVNKVFLTGRLTRDPEMRSLASGKNVTTVSDAVRATG